MSQRGAQPRHETGALVPLRSASLFCGDQTNVNRKNVLKPDGPMLFFNRAFGEGRF
jgi:hypothetical protein